MAQAARATYFYLFLLIFYPPLCARCNGELRHGASCCREAAGRSSAPCCMCGGYPRVAGATNLADTSTVSLPRSGCEAPPAVKRGSTHLPGGLRNVRAQAARTGTRGRRAADPRREARGGGARLTAAHAAHRNCRGTAPSGRSSGAHGAPASRASALLPKTRRRRLNWSGELPGPARTGMVIGP